MASTDQSTVKKFFWSRWFVIVGGIIVLLLVFSYARAFYQSYQIQKEIERLEGEKSRLDAKYLKTVELLHYVQSPAYVESKARVELNMIRPGEHAAIVQGAGASSTSRQASGTVVPSPSNLVLWWNYFFKNSPN